MDTDGMNKQSRKEGFYISEIASWLIFVEYYDLKNKTITAFIIDETISSHIPLNNR
jgi:hypothetical protein